MANWKEHALYLIFPCVQRIATYISAVENQTTFAQQLNKLQAF